MRNGNIKVFDLLMRKVNITINGEENSSHLSKPNGIVGIYEESPK
jgi:hypothetical protein